VLLPVFLVHCACAGMLQCWRGLRSSVFFGPHLITERMEEEWIEPEVGVEGKLVSLVFGTHHVTLQCGPSSFYFIILLIFNSFLFYFSFILIAYLLNLLYFYFVNKVIKQVKLPFFLIT